MLGLTAIVRNSTLISLATAALVLAGCSGGDRDLDDALPGAAAPGDDQGDLDDFDIGDPGDPGDVPDYCGSTLTGTLRDFRQSHPDFEYLIAVDPGIVLGQLGADGLPQYAGLDDNPTTHGAEPFDQWFRSVSGINEEAPLSLELTEGDGVYTYDNGAFFPLDGKGFGNEGHAHNYHFTFELHTAFEYLGGEVFTFTGDDDLFTFINGRLAIDLGGVHGSLSGTIDLDAQAESLGIEPGNVYTLDFFFAERHTTESHFRIDTTIGSFVDCGSPVN